MKNTHNKNVNADSQLRSFFYGVVSLCHKITRSVACQLRWRYMYE